MKNLFVFCTLVVINCIWLAIYSRVEERVEKQKKISRNKVIFNKTDIINNKASVRAKIKKLYNDLDHYFYGYLRYNIILVGKIPSTRIRWFFYKIIFGMKITKKTVIYGGCEFRSPWNIKADNCVIAVGCVLDGREGIKIGENVVFGSFVHVWTEEHDVNSPMFDIAIDGAQPVAIGDRAWICSDSTILPGCKIGEGVVVASRAVVTKDCDPFGIYTGIPAKLHGQRNHELKYELSGKPHWHFY